MSSKKKETTQKSEIPAWLTAGSQQAVGLGQKIAGRPYQEYSGNRIAGLAPGEQMAVDRAIEGSGSFEPDMNRSRELANKGSQSFLDADMNAYMNPYLESALEPAAREMRDQMARSQEAAKTQAAMAGAFGGSRATLLENDARDQGEENLSDLYARGYASAFESASQRFDSDRAAARAGSEQFRAIGAQGQQLLTNEINNLLTTGGLQRNLEQAGLDFDYQEFVEARDWDITNLQPLLAALGTVPHNKTNTTTEKTSGGEFGMVLGAAATVAGAYFGNPALGSMIGGALGGGGGSTGMVTDTFTGGIVPSGWTAESLGLDI